MRVRAGELPRSGAQTEERTTEEEEPARETLRGQPVAERVGGTSVMVTWLEWKVGADSRNSGGWHPRFTYL